MVAEKQASDNCKLLLVTDGGDPGAAYKIGKYIQRRYESFSILISGFCKSAGTLLSIAAYELIFTPYGELGPLDVQMQKEDKIGSSESGLNISEAFKAIEDRARDTYHNLIGEILSASHGVVSFHTASHAAAEMVASLYSPIFARIDPEEVGSRSRAMRIGEDYTNRLNIKWENLKTDRVEVLSRHYSSHEFVIDFDEATALFERVNMANDDEIKLVESLGVLARHPGKKLKIKYLGAIEESETGEKKDAKGSEGEVASESGQQPKSNGGDSTAPS